MHREISRRVLLQSVVGAGLASAVAAEDAETPSPSTVSSTGDCVPELRPFDQLMTRFIAEHRVPGAALALTRHSRVVYSRGFGWADRELQRPVQPDSLFRIASISKPLTAVAVLQLVQGGKFALDDRAFDLLPAQDWLPDEHDPRLRLITVRQLLQHTAGWDRDTGFDPIGVPRRVARRLKKPLPVGPADVVRFTLTLKLDFDPGTKHAYSNVGYLILGRLIEQMSGQSYESYVQQKVLQPLGISAMQLGRAWKDDLAPGEVCYYDHGQAQATAICGTRLGETVPLVYGGQNIEAFEAHGGWVASALDLVKFAAALDQPEKSPILSEAMIRAMWSRPEGSIGHDESGKPLDAYYGLGWMIRPQGERHNTWHNGLIAGTSTLLVRRFDGLNWAVLFNADSTEKNEYLSSLIDPLLHQAANAVTQWPEL